MAKRTSVANQRSDAVRSRSLLLDAVGRVLATGRVDFSVPELASEAGVGVATAYRHFSTPSEALHGYYTRAATELLDALTSVDPGLSPHERFNDCCAKWVEQAERWGPAVRHIRSHRGFLERVDATEAPITALYDVLEESLQELISAGRMVDVELRPAVLMWVTIFDERVVYDLEDHNGWSGPEVTDYLTRSVKGALGIT